MVYSLLSRYGRGALLPEREKNSMECPLQAGAVINIIVYNQSTSCCSILSNLGFSPSQWTSTPAGV